MNWGAWPVYPLRGSKRHLICDGQGLPLAVRMTGDKPERLARSPGVGGCDSSAARERGDRGSGRSVCSGIAATTRPPFGVVSGLVRSCRC